MRKKLFVGAALLCSALLWGGESTVAQTVVSSYPYEENFDDTETGGIPEGWVVEGTEGGGDYYVPEIPYHGRQCPCLWLSSAEQPCGCGIHPDDGDEGRR